uniref:Uncharacterized protein n=1 Tax=Timema monikensis TaxID=170555 RepID=A0A7R9EC17_9NEOP|nr:unnamed protein product [Timema monikensis]
MPQQRSSRRGSGYRRGSSNRYPYQEPQWGQVFQSSQDNLLSQLTSPEATLAIASNLISTLLQSQQTQVHSYTDRGQPGGGRGGSNYGQRGQYPNRKYGDYHNNDFYREGQVRRGGSQRGQTGGPYRERTTGTQRGHDTMRARGRGGSNKQPMRGKVAGKKDEAVDKKRSIKLAQNVLERSPNKGSGGSNVAYFMQGLFRGNDVGLGCIRDLRVSLTGVRDGGGRELRGAVLPVTDASQRSVCSFYPPQIGGSGGLGLPPSGHEAREGDVWLVTLNPGGLNIEGGGEG